ncbi:MAG: tRNA pseudouridine(13) synthase TruD [Planctomycetaceae bacterium]|nr:tRNA pseudouridine(13) synthase TruD [Planctomycetaceae bacterium]
MKLKRLPEDFQVQEQVDLAPHGGPFAFYRLTKEGLGTPEAIDAVLAQWNLSRAQVAYAGLKDRHARTTQFVTIKGGPRRGFRQENLELAYVGQVGRPIHARDITANRFVVVIRDLTDQELAAASAALASIAASGLPNYFDDQRFGSLGESGDFIARPWCLGDYERAVWLALAEPNVHDRPDEREQKRILRECWGDWPKCKALLDRSHRRSIVTYLADKQGDFRRAIALIRQDLRSIWLAAFQSHLWNQIAARLIRLVCLPGQLVTQTIGRRELPFFLSLDDAQRDELAKAILPLPSARLHLDESPLKPLYDQVLAAEGIELRQIRVKYPRDTFFSKGERPLVFRPGELSHDAAADEIYPRRQKLTLRFTLPRGSYATILVKRVCGIDVDDT